LLEQNISPVIHWMHMNLDDTFNKVNFYWHDNMNKQYGIQIE
jgi:hypothetical protein